jgi:hypothetical protein
LLLHSHFTDYSDDTVKLRGAVAAAVRLMIANNAAAAAAGDDENDTIDRQMYVLVFLNR